MASKKNKQKILCFINSDYGQANIFLATAFAIMQKAPDVELHIASFPPLEDEVNETSKEAREAKQNGMATRQEWKEQGIIFHSIKVFRSLKHAFVLRSVCRRRTT
jgi:hypothetical protein